MYVDIFGSLEHASYKSIDFVYSCDGAYTTQDGRMSVSQLTSPFSTESNEALNVRTCAQWFHRVLASLDAYCWLIGNSLVTVSQLLTGGFPIESQCVWYE